MKIFWLIISLLLALTKTALGQDTINPLKQILAAHPEDFAHLLAHPDRFELQLIYTQIDNGPDGRIFNSFHVGLDTSRYFYPASTVKMPVAAAALEKLNQLQIIGLDEHTPMHTHAGRFPQTAALADSSAADLKASIAHYIKKVFLVSDNDAYNRLYEFLGQEELNRRLRDKGYDQLRIIHRFSDPRFGLEGNRYTNPVSFYKDDTLVYHQGEVCSFTSTNLPLKAQQKGVAYIKDGEKITAPFDFSTKNFVSLQALHDQLKSIIFPEYVSEQQRFELTAGQYQLLLDALSMRPRQSDFPTYDKPDGYVKFWMYGGDAEHIPEHIKIYNKVGLAYGYLIDVAYVVDLKNEVEFMLAGVIHVNANQTYNDNEYEYDTIGFPFFRKLGNHIYDYELKRERYGKTDLSRFR